MGLLDRARTLDEKSTPSGIGSPKERVDAALSTVGEATGLVDYPGEVFRAFRSVIGFSKGAFLLPDEESGEFYPWISVGLDRTTTRRLRIPRDLAAADSRVVSETNPEILGPMLSNREHGLIRLPLLIRLGDREDPTALILTTDGPPPPARLDGALTQALETLNDRLGDEISKSRSLMESGERREEPSLSEWLEAWGDKDAVLVILDASGAIDALVEAIDGLELYRARKDTIALLRRITGRMGRLRDIKDGRVAILFPPERLSDEELWLHQLSLAFASAFKNLAEPPTFDAEFHPWPESRSAVEAALTGLL